MGGYAQPTAAGMYGTDVMASYGIAIATGPGAGGAAENGGPLPPAQGDVGDMVFGRDFFRSSAFGLLLLVAFCIYLDLRVLNR